MGNIKIDIESDLKRYSLTGDIELLSSNRRIQINFRDALGADFSSPDAVYIPYETETKEQVLSRVQRTLEKFGIGEARTEAVEHELQDYLEAESNFEEFSRQAKDIRNNKCNEDDLRKFAEALDRELKGRTLYPLQLLSAYHLAFSQHACNFSVPGAGKTSIVYGAYAYLRQLPPDDPKHVDKLMIVGPLSSFLAWEDEYFECFGEKSDTKRLSGGVPIHERIRHLNDDTPHEITLVSYAGLPSILDETVTFLRNNRTMVVLDEAHKIKKIDGGIWADSVLKIARYCKSRVVLTGTPVPNGFQDLNNLFEFLYPGKNLLGFRPFQLTEMSEADGDSRVQELVENISPYFIRIKKSDLNLPPATNHPPIMVPMGPVQQEIYDFIDKSYESYFRDVANEVDGPLKDMLSKARLIRLMQAATNPALLHKPIGQFYDDGEVVNDVFIDDTKILSKIMSYKSNEIPSKFVEAGRLAKEIVASGGKAVVWASFVDNIKGLQAYLTSLGIESKLLFGEVPVETENQEEGLETRESIIREFHEEGTFPIVIANPFAVAESISLHKVCHNAIYLERSYNASHFLQSKDRIHRVGLEKGTETNYYYLLSQDSIDGVIHDALDVKEQRMLKLIESEEIPLINMNMDYEKDADNEVKSIIREYVARRT